MEEIRLIRGFDELFEGINLDAAFTVYGTAGAVNPNLASREALMLLPGMDADLVEQIIAYREQRDFRTIREVGEIVPLERMVELSPWLGFNTSSFYSVYAYPAPPLPEEESLERRILNNEPVQAPAADTVTRAYMQILEVRRGDMRGRVYKVHPYGQLPDTAPARVEY